MSDDASSPSAAASKPDRTLLAILIVVAAVIAVAIVVVAVRSTGATALDPSTPEGVVQAYSRAVLAGDEAEAAEYLAGPSDDCNYYYDGEEEDLRLTLRSTVVSGDVATVKVTVTTSYGYGGGPFSSSEYSHEDAFRLVRSGRSWLVDETPYEFISCAATAGD